MKKSLPIIMLCFIIFLAACSAVTVGAAGKGITQEQVITYRGNLDFCDTNAVGKDYIYACLEDGVGLYQIGTDGKTMEQFPLFVPEEMQIARVAVDAENLVHVLLSVREEYVSEAMPAHVEVWKLDAEGNVLKTISLAEMTEGELAVLHISNLQDDGTYERLMTESEKNAEKIFSKLKTPGEFEKTVLGRHVMPDGRLLVIDTFAEAGETVTQCSIFSEKK